MGLRSGSSGGVRELLNDLENRFEFSVVFLLHLCQFSCQFLVARQQFAKPDKRSHNLDACLNCLLAIEIASQHHLVSPDKVNSLLDNLQRNESVLCCCSRQHRQTAVDHGDQQGHEEVEIFVQYACRVGRDCDSPQ